ncbi:cellulose biosynthesis protein BcsQ [Halomonas sp. KO116]|uniref:cellulose biosynthesis protein BcsQ n=1 Tax=Halomonas sp. KO116 TaxID=1504981 RepID=UPI0004E3DEEB|nr:cellulose biosynthesis protein BcsQ [Halomonas sp. KO116]AJY50161.1 cellulose synthase operon protein YhjQ [Halomonas sp. KO116]
MTLICVASPKGGVGKTTLTANLAYTFQRQGFNVTVIDFDSQDALKLHFGIAFNDPQGYVAEATSNPYWHEMVRTTSIGINVLAYGPTTREERYRFESYISSDPQALYQSLRSFYDSPDDVLLVDLPPGHSVALDAICKLKPLCVTALLSDSASLAVLPSIEEGDFYSGDVSRHLYYVVNQLDLRSELSRDVYSLLKERLGASLLGSVHRDPAVSEAHALQVSVLQHAYTSAVVNDLEVIAHNLMRLMPDTALVQIRQVGE